MNEIMKRFSDEQIEKIELQGEDTAQKLLYAYNKLTDIQERLTELIPQEAEIIGKVKTLKSQKSYLTTIVNILSKELRYLDVR